MRQTKASRFILTPISHFQQWRILFSRTAWLRIEFNAKRSVHFVFSVSNYITKGWVQSYCIRPWECFERARVSQIISISDYRHRFDCKIIRKEEFEVRIQPKETHIFEKSIEREWLLKSILLNSTFTTIYSWILICNSFKVIFWGFLFQQFTCSTQSKFIFHIFSASRSYQPMFTSALSFSCPKKIQILNWNISWTITMSAQDSIID